jgi:hypothetical protein
MYESVPAHLFFYRNWSFRSHISKKNMNGNNFAYIKMKYSYSILNPFNETYFFLGPFPLHIFQIYK